MPWYLISLRGARSLYFLLSFDALNVICERNTLMTQQANYKWLYKKSVDISLHFKVSNSSFSDRVSDSIILWNLHLVSRCPIFAPCIPMSLFL